MQLSAGNYVSLHCARCGYLSLNSLSGFLVLRRDSESMFGVE
jgi:hypothetical protein